jgi:hypothetical protein
MQWTITTIMTCDNVHKQISVHSIWPFKIFENKELTC